MLTAAVTLFAVFSALNLLLTFGVIRRLRVHDTMLGRTARAGMPDVLLAAGGEPQPFEPVATTSGGPLTRDDLRGAVVAFFSHDCAGCREQAPAFVELARALEPGRVVAVVAGDPAANRELVGALEPFARVTVEPHQGPVQRAFAVRGFPAMCVLDGDGLIEGTATTVDALSALLAGRVTV